MVLYKYIKKEHLNAFFKNGTIKIGSLYEYREVEKYGTVIGDDNEGSYHTVLHKDGSYEIDLSKSSSEADFFRKHVLRPDQQNSNVKIRMADGAKIISKTNSPDLYIYCVSSKYDPVVMREFGCDCCIEIHHPDIFFKAISKKIRHKAKLMNVVSIVYGNKTVNYLQPHQVHPVIKKGTEYSYQSEVRAIWAPKEKIKSPLFIKVPKAICACRVFTP